MNKTPDQVKQELLEELKEAHAEMFSGKLSPLYLDNLMSTALDRYGEAVVAQERERVREYTRALRGVYSARDVVEKVTEFLSPNNK